tara:strand:- start:616 stop:945 length:330 start_codon:yes stop_codon:yes gene_type:complete
MNKIHALIIALFNANASQAKNADKIRLEACETLAGEVKELGKEMEHPKLARSEVAEFKAYRTLLVLALNQVISKLTPGQAKNVEQRLGGKFTKLTIKPNGDYRVDFKAA